MRATGTVACPRIHTRFELQDRAVHLFRAFATSRNVHITLVIHPRKEEEGLPLSTRCGACSPPPLPPAYPRCAVSCRSMGFKRSTAASHAGAGPAHSSVFGTAKATQEADNVIILQRGRRWRYLAVRKNRVDGELGMVPYRYDKASGRVRARPPRGRTASDWSGRPVDRCLIPPPCQKV